MLTMAFFLFVDGVDVDVVFCGRDETWMQHHEAEERVKRKAENTYINFN